MVETQTVGMDGAWGWVATPAALLYIYKCKRTLGENISFFSLTMQLSISLPTFLEEEKRSIEMVWVLGWEVRFQWFIVQMDLGTFSFSFDLSFAADDNEVRFW